MQRRSSRTSCRMLGLSLSGLLMLTTSAPGGAQTATLPATGLATDPVAADVQGSDTLTDAQAASALTAAITAPAPTCKRQLTANVVALDQVFFYNRLGAVNPAGMVYALRRDVVERRDGQSRGSGRRIERRPCGPACRQAAAAAGVANECRRLLDDQLPEPSQP